MNPEGDDRSTTVDPAEVERAEHPDSFDPGTETGYLRRGHRDHDLDIDSGAAPFDPGPDHYDDRRARRDAKKAEKSERKRLEREAKDRATRERAEAQAREKQVAASRDRAERERRATEEADRAERDRLARDEDLKAQRERTREAEAEKADRAHAERGRLRQEERDRAASERAERKRAKQAEREQRDAGVQAERERIAAERAERDRAERERARRRQPSSGGTAVASRPKATTKLKPSERLKLSDLNLQPAGKPSPEAPAPRLSHKPAHVSLRWPTAKVGAALLVVAAVAALAGSAVGLPVPGLSDDSAGQPTDSGVDPASLALLDAGTPVGLSEGPYHPVVGDEIGYGEQLAKFGAPRSGRRHEGQDVFAKPGTPLVSVRDGVVVDGEPEDGPYSGGRGNYVVIYSQLDGRSYVYLHMLKPSLVKKGDIVEAGQPIGQVGCTGSCDGPHLHFEVRNGRQTLTAETKAVDPLPLLKDWPSVPVPAQG